MAGNEVDRLIRQMLQNPTGTYLSQQPAFQQRTQDLYLSNMSAGGDERRRQEHQARTLSQQPAAPPISQLELLYAQLARGLGTGGGNVPSPDEIRRMAERQVAPQFDATIANLTGQMGDTKKRAGANKKELAQLYKELANSYGGDVAAATRDNQGAIKQEKANLSELENTLASQYTQAQNQQTAEFNQLGIQQATPQALSGQQQDLGFLQSLGKTEGAASLNSLIGQGQAENTFLREGAGIARNEGAGRISDLQDALERYLREMQGEVGQVQGQKRGAIEELVNGMTQSYHQQQGDVWDDLMKLANLRMAIDKQGNAGQSKAFGANATSGLLGATNYLTNTVGPQGAQNTINIIQELLQTQQFRENRFEGANGDKVRMTPEQAATLARQFGQKKGLGPGELTALINGMLAYYGKLS